MGGPHVIAGCAPASGRALLGGSGQYSWVTELRRVVEKSTGLVPTMLGWTVSEPVEPFLHCCVHLLAVAYRDPAIARLGGGGDPTTETTHAWLAPDSDHQGGGAEAGHACHDQT
jgi:hypothetical protein